MKTIIILGDGMADEPLAELGGKTPLQVAHKPTIDWLANNGQNGLLDTTTEGFEPASDIANLSILGYDVVKVYDGRASLEAASMEVVLSGDELALRCNLICLENGKIKNHSAGQITTEEATILISDLNDKLGNETVRFHSGVSYRHLLTVKNASKNIICIPPHNALGTNYQDILIEAKCIDNQYTVTLLNSLILKSQEILSTHPINTKRVKEGKDPANSIWLWSPGYSPHMDTLQSKYGIKSGVVISAVDLINGMGIYAGLMPIRVDGANGLHTTNYEGKARAATDALKHNDFVFVHLEASDEASHMGDALLKVKTIEYLDSRIIKPILDEISSWDEAVTIAILPDHPTSCRTRMHTADAVPFIIYRKGIEADSVFVYDELAAKEGIYGLQRGADFMDILLNRVS